MNHILWIDLYNRRFEDEIVDDETFESICDYAKQGFAQILAVKSMKEEVK